MVIRLRTGRVLAAAVVLLLAGCSPADSPSVSLTPTPVSAESPAGSPPALKEPSSPAVPFGAPHRYADGVTVEVSSVSELTLGPFPSTEDPEAKEGDPYFVFTVRYQNGSPGPVELTPFFVVLVGDEGRIAPRVAMEENDHLVLAADESMEFDVACLVAEADRSRVVLEISDPAGDRGVAFVGSAT